MAISAPVNRKIVKTENSAPKYQKTTKNRVTIKLATPQPTKPNRFDVKRHNFTPINQFINPIDMANLQLENEKLKREWDDITVKYQDTLSMLEETNDEWMTKLSDLQDLETKLRNESLSLESNLNLLVPK
jgi:hypothetical protein